MSYLNNHPLLVSSDLSELRDLLSYANGIQKVETVGKNTEIDVNVCGVLHDGMHVGNFQYGGALTKYYSCEGPDTLQLIIISSGTGQTEYRHENFVMNNKVGFMRDLREEHVSTAGDIDGLGMQLPLDRIKDHARNLIGEGADLIIPKFETNFDLTTPGGRHIRNTLAYVADALNAFAPQNHNELILKSLSDLMLTHVLQLIPNSYSALLDSTVSAKPIPRYLKRARDYIHAHAASPITLETLVGYSGCSYRTLQIAFNDAYGMSPMGYVKHVRLSFAHDDLLHAADGVTVRDVALKWGFTHLGWFSKKYLEQFGILPSQTLRMRD